MTAPAESSRDDRETSRRDRQERLLDQWTRRITTVGFTGLALIALLTMFDSIMRWLSLPRIPGFTDIGEVIYAVVIATCFPAGLIQGNNITLRFLGAGLGTRAGQWLESFGSLMTLLFFSLLGWQFVLLTLDFQKNGRVTETLELPITPWWWLTTAVILLCVPVQIWVFADRLVGAVTGRLRIPVGERDEPEPEPG